MVLSRLQPISVALSSHAFDAPASNLEGHVYNTSDGCVAFLSNIDASADSSVSFGGRNYSLPAWSVTVLQDCQDDVFVTSRVSGAETQLVSTTLWAATAATTKYFPDIVGGMRETYGVLHSRPLEQLEITKDATDYLWYSTKSLLMRRILMR